MSSRSLEREILDQVKRLALEQQERVLDFARALESARPSGVPGKSLLRFAGTIAADDLKIMEMALEESAEKVNPNEW